MSRLRLWSLVLLATSALGLSACGSSSGNPTTKATTATTAGVQTPPGTTSSAGASGASTIAAIPAQNRSPAGVTGTAPTVVVPSGDPPAQLESADLIVGTGPAATAGGKITVQYVLATYSSRKVIQSSWTSQPFQFTLGEGQVITGWDRGVLGMRVGGRRELIIPPSLGYGDQSPGPGIAANDTLVFVIDLEKIG
jgi:peptidylprolyl isomerase